MSWSVAIAAGVAATASGIKAISASSKRKKAENELENYAKSYQPNQSIMDFYNKSLAKYNENPYESASFQQQKDLINKNLATGINSAQTRRGGLASIGTLVSGANTSLGRAAAGIDAQKMNQLGLLGRAAGAKTAEEQKKFDMLYNLKAQKAGQLARTQNMAEQNAYNQLNNIGMMSGSFGGSGGGKKKSDIDSTSF